MPLLGSRGAASSRGFGSLANLGYFLRNSLRFRSSSSAYLTRTPTSASNRKTFTYSFWMKYSISSQYSVLFSAQNSGGGDQDALYIDNVTYAHSMVIRLDSITGIGLATTQVFRDPSAWYHIVMALDTTQATAANRLKLYVNGAEVTSFITDGRSSITQNSDMNCWNTNRIHLIGSQAQSYPAYTHNGYMAEINFIDGQALTPSSFGKTDGATGQWVPKKFGGAYGTNGFYLNFTDTSSTSNLVKDNSGNGNNWTPNNISLTSGVTYDSMTDVPTLAELSGNGNSNYCVFNPLDKGSTNFTFSNGNLTVSGASASSSARATMAVSSGKWYWEATPTAIGNGLGVGFAGDSTRFNPVNWNSGTYVIYQSDGNKHINGSASSYGSSYTTNDVIGVALDMDAGTITFYKNNVSQGTASTGLTGVYLPVFSQTSGATTGTINANFGAGSGFSYTPPSGFKALNTFNLP